MMLTPDQALSLSPVIPVVVLEDASQAVPLARALLSGGVRTIEVTMRTPVALDAMRAIATAAPDMVVGAGTVLSGDDIAAAASAGARYALSPGATHTLLRAGRDAPIPLIPGIATASEAMLGIEFGYRCFKFFPAEQLGGAEALKALAGPLPSAKFCPTGGIGLDRAPAYLALANVLCIGGSWIAPASMIKAGDWAGIEALARRATSFRGDP